MKKELKNVTANETTNTEDYEVITSKNREINPVELMNLPFGSMVRVVWHNSEYHKENDSYLGVIVGRNIMYEDGKWDPKILIAECASANNCKLFREYQNEE